MIQRLNIDRSVVACGWRTAEFKELSDAILEVFRDLTEDVENNSECPGSMLEVHTTMIPKEADPDLEEISPDGPAVPEATEMRPINLVRSAISAHGNLEKSLDARQHARIASTSRGYRRVAGILNKHAACGSDGHTGSGKESGSVKMFRLS